MFRLLSCFLLPSFDFPGENNSIVFIKSFYLGIWHSGRGTVLYICFLERSRDGCSEKTDILKGKLEMFLYPKGQGL